MMEEFIIDLNNEISIKASTNGESNQDSFLRLFLIFL